MHSSGDYQHQNMPYPPQMQPQYSQQYPPQKYAPQQPQRNYSGHSNPSQYDQFIQKPINGYNNPFPS